MLNFDNNDDDDDKKLLLKSIMFINFANNFVG